MIQCSLTWPNGLKDPIGQTLNTSLNETREPCSMIRLMVSSAPLSLSLLLGKGSEDVYEGPSYMIILSALYFLDPWLFPSLSLPSSSTSQQYLPALEKANFSNNRIKENMEGIRV